MQGLGEVMRAQPVKPVSGLPPFVEGLSVIRGRAIPVVHLSLLLCGAFSPLTDQQRLVTVDCDGHRVALRVDEVAGLQPLEMASWHKLPNLVEQVHASYLSALGSLGGELVLFLRCARLLSPEEWEVLGS